MADRREYRQQYRLQHRDEILEKNKIYYQKNKDIIIEKAKAYREGLSDERKEKLAEQIKEHWEKNKARYNEKVPCDVCGTVITKRIMANHKKSKNCIAIASGREGCS